MSIDPALERALERLSAQVQQARAHMETGEGIVLTSLETQVLDFCRTVETLPVPVGRALRPRMTALLDDLNQLDHALRRRQGELGASLGQMATRRRAVAAYTPPVKPGSR